MSQQQAFQAAVLERLSRAALDASAQAALLQVLSTAATRVEEGLSSDDEALQEWLGEQPPNPVQLEFEALKQRFSERRQLLAQTISTAEVTQLLAAGSRQTVHDRLRAESLLGLLDQGRWRFPLWQFDPDGPNGVIEGLPQVLQTLRLSTIAKARWLQRPQPVFGGLTPLELLRQGKLCSVLEEAEHVGRGQD